MKTCESCGQETFGGPREELLAYCRGRVRKAKTKACHLSDEVALIDETKEYAGLNLKFRLKNAHKTLAKWQRWIDYLEKLDA